MFGMESLDLLIGLVTVYLTMALACTAIVEAIAALVQVRTKNLNTAMSEFLNGKITEDKDFVQAFYSHPLVQSLSIGEKGRPAYIPPAIVSQVVQSLLSADDDFAKLRAAIDALPGTTETNRIKGLLTALAVEAKQDVASFRKHLEVHFDSVMDRASGWVKKLQSNIALAVSIVFVFGANVDTFELAKTLSTRPEARAQLLSIAAQQLATPVEGRPDLQKAVTRDISPAPSAPSPSQASGASVKNLDNPQPKAAETNDPLDQVGASAIAVTKNISQASLAASAAGVQFGWQGWPNGPAAFVLKFLGLLVTAFAVALGAPFWFDVLQKFMRVRAAGISPREK